MLAIVPLGGTKSLAPNSSLPTSLIFGLVSMNFNASLTASAVNQPTSSISPLKSDVKFTQKIDTLCTWQTLKLWRTQTV